jgi:hypothetical protein
MRKSFVLHEAQIQPLMGLSFEDKGRIFDAIIRYQFEDSEAELTPVLNMAFTYIKGQLDLDNEKYESRCERNRKNGARGGRPKDEKPTGFSGLQKNPTEPKKAENENENENDLSFVRFWDLYDKKVGKPKALKMWMKLSSKERDAIFNHLPKYINSTLDKQYRKNPETYMRNRTWKDEIIQPTNFANRPNNSVNGSGQFIQVQPKQLQAI